VSTAVYWRRRLTRHAWLGALSLGITAALFALLEQPRTVVRLSMGTAYAALVLLAISLVIGPLQVLRGRPNPVSTDLRRDVGIWAALFGVLHTIFGLQVHMGGRFWLYFLYPPDQPHRLPLRHDMFGIENYSGLGATLMLLMLLAISNDVSLRRLGSERWKSLQRWSYAAALLTLVHSILYMLPEKGHVLFQVAFGVVAVVTLVLQAGGYRRIRRGKAAPA
jgi:sulfoxide reductase heme-binding subunit YedZ